VDRRWHRQRADDDRQVGGRGGRRIGRGAQSVETRHRRRASGDKRNEDVKSSGGGEAVHQAVTFQLFDKTTPRKFYRAKTPRAQRNIFFCFSKLSVLCAFARVI